MMLTTRLLAIDLLRTLSRRRANALLLFLLFWLLIVVSCSLKVTGGSVVQGHAIPIDETAQIRPQSEARLAAPTSSGFSLLSS